MTVNLSKSVSTKASLQINELSQIAFPFWAYFSISPACCRKARTGSGFSWETAVKPAMWANISLFIHTYEQTGTQTGKQTHVRANTIQKVRGMALPDTHRPRCLRILLRLSSTPSFAHQLIHVTSACVCPAAVCVRVCAYQVRVCVDVFVQVTQMFVFRNPCVWFAHFRSWHP